MINKLTLDIIKHYNEKIILNFLKTFLGKYQLLVYVDDNMVGENLQTIRENTEIFIKASKDIGLEVNSDKTKMYDNISPTKYSTKSKYSN